MAKKKQKFYVAMHEGGNLYDFINDGYCFDKEKDALKDLDITHGDKIIVYELEPKIIKQGKAVLTVK